jgi:hypothetical protein
MGFLPGLPGIFLGSQPSGGSDASLDLPAPAAGTHFSLRQYCVGSVATGSFTPAPGIHGVGEGYSDPGTDTYGWAPCTASFTEDTLPGSLLVCVGILNGDFFGDASKSPILVMDAGLDSWTSAASFATSSIFNKGLPCQSTFAGGVTQVPQADGLLLYKANAPVVAAGTLFYGGVNSADWCNNFAYQMILAEFESDGATLDSFSFNNAVRNPGDQLSLTGRLPSDNPSFVIAMTYGAPGNGAEAGSGFTLASATSLGGGQWQWQEFAAQPTGYASPQWPGSCPGLSGSFELGFDGDVVAGVTAVGAFVWNLLFTGGGPPPPPPVGDDTQPNVCIIC